MATQTFCYAQETQVKYYNSKYQEVPEKKARYVKTVTKNDGATTSTQTDLRTGDINSETFKDYEPYGVWVHGKQKLDYNFRLHYADEACTNETLPKLNDYFADVVSLGYKAPKVSQSEDFYYFLGRNIQYPAPAKENGIEGKVYAQFTIGKDGSVKNIIITKSAHILLDKEYARVLRKMKFAIPPTMNGKPVELCVIAPASFKLG